MLDARLSKQIVGTITRWIVCRQMDEDGKLPPLKELARLFGVSVTTVREAVVGLQTLGILTMRHGVGAYVASPDTVLDDMYRTRRDLEMLLAERAAPVISDGQIGRMDTHYRGMQAAAERQDLNAYGEHDAAFHAVVFKAGESPILASVVTFVKYGLFSPNSYMLDELAKSPDYLVTSNRDHRELLDAMKSRDPVRARAAVSSHLDRAYSTWSSHLDSMCNKAKSELAQLDHYLL